MSKQNAVTRSTCLSKQNAVIVTELKDVVVVTYDDVAISDDTDEESGCV